MEPTFEEKWKVNELSKALLISDDDVKDYFTDGRRASFLMEHICRKKSGTRWELAESEGDPYDLVDPKGGKWEVRCITESTGVNFAPSNNTGKGRKYVKEDFMRKLKELSGYFLADVTSFPQVKFYKLSIKSVENFLDWLPNKYPKTSKTIILKWLADFKNK